ncbi:peptide-methionine (S)-S-oxide reductase MsrA [Thalassospira lucentensis]
MQGVFQHVNGVISSVAGYAGGSAETATYIQTETGTTGHAEAVRITFDPRVVSYGTLLRIFFSVAHDPTQLDRQGPDTGTQYPSAIFPLNREQADVAQKYITQINRSGIFKTRIATNIELGKTFYPAESYHQNYLYEHPTQLYITVYELPKIKDLKDIFPAQFRTDPVLVAK